jgi:hypothetical protein
VVIQYEKNQLPIKQKGKKDGKTPTTKDAKTKGKEQAQNKQSL